MCQSDILNTLKSGEKDASEIAEILGVSKNAIIQTIRRINRWDENTNQVSILWRKERRKNIYRLPRKNLKKCKEC